jgi:predicted CXXCH cytochrome family protein
MRFIKQLLLSLFIALPVLGFMLFVTQAKADEEPTQSQFTTDCATCHADIQEVWETGLHGQAFADPIFAQAWEAQGKPGACLVCHTTGYDPATGAFESEGVGCVSCHGPANPNHPNEPMPVDTSSDTCGACHSDPRFATENWQMSAHYQRDMTCATCHDTHTAGIKTVEGADSPDPSALCTNCHKEVMLNFPTSKHAAAGVTCVTCHLDTPGGSGDGTAETFETAHVAPDHNFLPTVATCNKCHSDQMHAPGESAAAAAIMVEHLGGTPTVPPSPVVSPVPPPVANEPGPVSPVGFAVMAALIGIAGGFALSPLLTRLGLRTNQGGR